MSGSSLDGMDVGLIKISFENKRYNYKILEAKTVAYSKFWAEALSNAQKLSGEELISLDFQYGALCAEVLNEFKSKVSDDIDLVSYHGHTIFHDPEKGYTYALGNLSAVSTGTSLKTVGCYRDSDVALRGQGAPLMAIADLLLFEDFQVNINLGGICNLSVAGDESVAYDICPCNQLYNVVYDELRIPYDNNGALASTGSVISTLSDELNKEEYYARTFPKSLDNNYIRRRILPSLDLQVDEKDKLATITQFVSSTIGKEIQKLIDKDYVKAGDKILLTGGGALNNFLVNKIKEELNSKQVQVVIPSEEIINFKELVLMALLGFMRVNGEMNIVNKATGGSRGSKGGGIYEC